MLKYRIKRRDAAGTFATARLAQVEAAVVALDNEDLLDLADIFKTASTNPLMEMAAREMTRRAISL